MAQNIYDDGAFFLGYSGLLRSVKGLDGAPEWPTLRAMLPPMRGKRVVDLGCGFGWFSRWAADAGAESVVGIDLSENMLRRAADETDTAVITYLRHDLDRLELPAESFDVAYSSLTLHYVADLHRLMTAVHQSLVGGGMFVFSVEHPIYTAPSNPTFVTDSSGAVSWPVDQYLMEGRRTTDWLVPGVEKYHRTIGTYLSCLHDAGLVLQTLCEWGPDALQVAEHPEWAVELERPQFMLVGARRE
ncbi:MAG: class I SAM-dependent methyltransferase [Ilumatobacteraceae bacterium]